MSDEDPGLARIRQKLEEAYSNGLLSGVRVLPRGVDGPIQSDLAVTVTIPLGPAPLPGQLAEIRQYVPGSPDGGPLITSVFGLRLEALADGAVLAVDLLMARKDDGGPLVLLEKTGPYLDSQYDGLATLPRRWFRVNLAELRSR